MARQLKKHNQPGIQVLAMHSPDDAGNRRWEAYIKLTKEDPRNSAKMEASFDGTAYVLGTPLLHDCLGMRACQRSRFAKLGRSGGF